MSALWLLVSVVGPIIQSWVALALVFLAVLVLSLPRLLGRGLVAACRGAWTLLVPARRVRWLRARREKRERRRTLRAEVDLLGREVQQYGRDEVLRRSADRQYHRITGPARPDEETT